METFINSKHIKKDLKRKYVHGDKHIARTLDYVEQMHHKAEDIPKEKIDYCVKALSNSKTNKIARYETTLQELIKAQARLKQLNKEMLVKGIIITQLLDGIVMVNNKKNIVNFTCDCNKVTFQSNQTIK